MKYILLCFSICFLFTNTTTRGQNVKSPIQLTFYNVKAFGAIGNGKHLDQLAINKAIQNCADHGGGTVYLPVGTYLCGSIHLKSNIDLMIDAGAVILGKSANVWQ